MHFLWRNWKTELFDCRHNHLSRPLPDDLSSRLTAGSRWSHPKHARWCRCWRTPTFSHCCRRSGPGPRRRVPGEWPGKSSSSSPKLWPFCPWTTRRSTNSRSCRRSSTTLTDDQLTRLRGWRRKWINKCGINLKFYYYKYIIIIIL